MLSGLSIMGLFLNPCQPNRMSQAREARHCKARAQAVLEQEPSLHHHPQHSRFRKKKP
jgi:hypothetical protein